MGVSIKMTTPQEDRLEREEVLRMSRAQLKKYLVHGDCGESAQKLAMQRLALFDMAPAWYRSPVFIVGFLAMLFAAVAAWPIAPEWLPRRFQDVPSATAAESLPSTTASSSPPAPSPSGTTVSFPRQSPVVPVSTPDLSGSTPTPR